MTSAVCTMGQGQVLSAQRDKCCLHSGTGTNAVCTVGQDQVLSAQWDRDKSCRVCSMRGRVAAWFSDIPWSPDLHSMAVCFFVWPGDWTECQSIQSILLATHAKDAWVYAERKI